MMDYTLSPEPTPEVVAPRLRREEETDTYGRSGAEPL